MGEDEVLDLAVIGAGAAGTWVARAAKTARPDWSVTLFERNDRIGGRLRSVSIPGLDHPIELGGMRYLTSHRLVQGAVTDLGIATRPFDTVRGPERSFLRGRLGGGPGDPVAGSAYDLPDHERGRSAFDLTRDAFLRIVPRTETLDAAGWRRERQTASYLDRRLTDWSLADAMATIRSAEAHRFATDAFGYDSGFRPFNAGDAIEYLLGGGDPTAEARVPIEGMDRIPGALAQAFRERGGELALGRELERVDVGEGVVRLDFAGGTSVAARHVVLTGPIAALRILAAASPALDTPRHRWIYDSVEGFPAVKLYLWFDRPWWRSGAASPTGIRATTDLPLRKVFYFDEAPDAPAAMLATYTDGRDTGPWVALANGASNGAPAPAPLLEAVREQLRAIHPGTDVPEPAGSAFMHWGSDPHEIGWTYWRAGFVSDDVIEAATQPDPAVPIYFAGEAFSRSQAWVEGALESAEAVTGRLRS